MFQQIFRIAKREDDLNNIKGEDVFANIDQVLLANDAMWKDYLVHIINKTRKKRRPFKPSELLAAFHKVLLFFGH